MNVRCGEYPYLLRYIHGGAIHRTLFCYSGSPAPLCKNRVSMDGSTFFNYVWHFDGSRSADKNTITMTNKLKVFAMLLCVALFGIFSSCGKDDGGYSIPSNDNEIYNLLIGKWNVEIIGDEHEIPGFRGEIEFLESGELLANGVWSADDWSFYNNGLWNGKGSYALFKRHLILFVPDDVLSERGDRYGPLFHYSGTIKFITKNELIVDLGYPYRFHGVRPN